MKHIILIISLLSFLSACNNSPKESNDTAAESLSKLPYSGTKNDNQIIIHELSDPDKLNPITSQGAGSNYIQHSIFMYLLDIDKDKMDVIPWLASSRPSISILDEGPYKLRIDYEIRPDAVWDNGSPVTAHDVAFSFKATKNPHVDAEHQRPYIDFITKIEIDKEDDKKFSFYTSELHYAAEFSSGGVIYIIPEYIYDPQGLMRAYTLYQLSNKKQLEKIKDDKNLMQFAKEFNGEKFQREKGFISGCGPYEFNKWITGQRVVLSKKQDWWGENYPNQESFVNYPDKLIYEIINDQVTAVTAMKDEQIDIMRSMRPFDYADLKKDEKFNSKFFMFDEDFLSYTYIGLNMKHPILKEKAVRKAIAHCVNVPQIIDILNYGYAKPMASFVHPVKEAYNKNLEPYAFDLNKAKTYLADAGWEDTNGDGVLDKKIDGRTVPLKLTIKYNSGNQRREKVCLFLKENAQKIGIDIEIIVREWTVYLDECKNHEFDMYVLGWVQEAILNDPKQLFHTESYNGGSNYPGFGNAYTDQLIDSLRKEMNDKKRIKMLNELQEIVHDELPYVLLYSPENLLAIHKRFGNAKAYVARPGYEERALKLSPYKGVTK